MAIATVADVETAGGKRECRRRNVHALARIAPMPDSENNVLQPAVPRQR